MNSMLSMSLLPAAAAAPLAAAILLSVRRWRRGILRAAPLTAIPALLLVIAGRPGVQVNLPWLVQHTVLELDWVGRVFLGFSSVLWIASGWYARAYLKDDANPVRFHFFFFLAMSGNFTLILAGDIPTFYSGFALMSLASAGLVFHRGDPDADRAGRMYLTMAVFGEVLVLTGFLFLAVRGGTTQIAELHRGVFSRTALALLLAGFGIKAGALSLHFWLPLAHPAAPVPASAVLSGAMIKAGLLGWIRFLPLGEAAIPSVGFALISAGLGAAFLGTLAGVVQRNPKTVLAYSSISQMGIIISGLGIGAVRPDRWLEIQTAVLIYATHHALAKGALFLGVGPAHASHTRWQRLALIAGLLLPALALAGAPLTSGALAKTALKRNLIFLPDAWAAALYVLLPLAAVGTTLKMARFLWLAWPRRPHVAAASAKGMWLPWFFMVGAVLSGVWLLPGSWEQLPAKLKPETLWEAAWPLLAGGGLAALGAQWRRWYRGDLTRWLPAGDLGVYLERMVARILFPASCDSRHAHGHEHHKSTIEDSTPWPARILRAGESLARIEARLRSWPLAAPWLILLIGLLIGSLAAS